jgi:hypothetical protein
MTSARFRSAAAAALAAGSALLLAACDDTPLPAPVLTSTVPVDVHLDKTTPGWQVAPGLQTSFSVAPGGRSWRQCRQQVLKAGTVVADGPYVKTAPLQNTVATLGLWGNVIGGSGVFTVRIDCDFIPSTNTVSVDARFDPLIAWTAGGSATAQQGSGGWSFTLPAATADTGGAITYSVTDSGSAGCSISSGRVPTVAVTGNGSCGVTAAVGQTTSSWAGSESVSVTVTGVTAPEPTPTPAATCNGVIGDGGICIPPHSG